MAVREDIGHVLLETILLIDSLRYLSLIRCRHHYNENKYFLSYPPHNSDHNIIRSLANG